MARGVLVESRMKSAALAVILVAAASSAASAGTYLGLGLGTSASLGGDMSSFHNDGGRSGRLILGQQFGRLSIEGDATRYGLAYGPDLRFPYDGTSLAVAAKLDFPLGNNFAAFGRAGLQRTWLSPNVGTMNVSAYSGNGYLLGGGFEYHLDLSIIGGGAIFVDYTRNSTAMTGDLGGKLDGSASMWTLGLTLSL